MYETSKAVQRRLHDANFVSRYFRGNGIDIGSGNDQLGQYIELFPLMESCKSWDRDDGDAEHLVGVKDASYDFVHSSHCLEDMSSPRTALENWFRVLKPGGHLIVTVPDEDMYEQGIFPSTFNPDHKWTFTIRKLITWSNKSRNLLDLIEYLGDAADLIKIEQLIGTYRYGLDRQDQTRTPIGEAAIEFIIRKRPETRKHIERWTAPKEAPKAIALHRPGAIGDIIMTLSLVPLLKQKYPEHEIHYFCNGTIGKSLKRLMAAAGVNRGFNAETLPERRGNYEKVVDLIGYPLHEGYPEKPMRRHLIASFADEMGLAIVDYPELPHLTLDAGTKHVPLERYATIHPQAGWSTYKNWQQEKWEEVISKRPDIRFFQIGSAVDSKLQGANHYYMGTDLDASIDLMAHATLHLGVDSWTNHLTNIEWKGRGFTPAIILWGSTQASAAGYERNTNISMGLKCQPCFREDPKISRMPRGPCINPPGQDYEHPEHACMAGITVDMVISEIEKIWPYNTFHSFVNLLQPFDVQGFDKIRIGSDADGGYVMLNDFPLAGKVISLGIGDEISWDLAMAKRGLYVFQFDEAVSANAKTHRNFVFQRKRVVSSPSDENQISLAQIMNKPGNDLIAKIDIEGSEWEILANTASEILAHVKQFVIEFHWLRNFSDGTFRKTVFAALNNLLRTHCCIHVHGNNWEPFVIFDGVSFPNVFEATFVRRADYELIPSKATFPTELDRPCNPALPDLELGSWLCK